MPASERIRRTDTLWMPCSANSRSAVFRMVVFVSVIQSPWRPLCVLDSLGGPPSGGPGAGYTPRRPFHTETGAEGNQTACRGAPPSQVAVNVAPVVTGASSEGAIDSVG
jgi:hypothetical protein